MELIINGEARKVSSATLEQLAEELGLANKLVVAEIDGQIIEKDEWPHTDLKEGMKIELVHFVGGG